MITERILALLELSPMTSQALRSVMHDTTHNRVTAVLHRLREQGRVFIQQWDRNETGGRLYPRAIYALGSGPDARKPPRLSKKIYRERYKIKIAQREEGLKSPPKRISSVWDLGKQ